MLGKLKAEIEKLWSEVSGEARIEVEHALADVEAKVVKFQPLVKDAVTGIEAAIQTAAPEVQAAVKAEMDKLVAEVEALFSGK